MKKLYTILLTSLITLVSNNISAATWTVFVGGSANIFNPSGLVVNVGDVINFTWAGGNTATHNVTGVSIPGGAAVMSSGNHSNAGFVYPYTVTATGTYAYQCSIHAPGMSGAFLANPTGTGITDPTVNYVTNAYPNPCVDKITFKYNGVDRIALFNLLGENVRTAKLTVNEGSIDMDLDNMTAGIYFYRTYRDGVILETRKVIKSK